MPERLALSAGNGPAPATAVLIFARAEQRDQIHFSLLPGIHDDGGAKGPVIKPTFLAQKHPLDSPGLGGNCQKPRVFLAGPHQRAGFACAKRRSRADQPGWSSDKVLVIAKSIPPTIPKVISPVRHGGLVLLLHAPFAARPDILAGYAIDPAHPLFTYQNHIRAAVQFHDLVTLGNFQRFPQLPVARPKLNVFLEALF